MNRLLKVHLMQLCCIAELIRRAVRAAATFVTLNDARRNKQRSGVSSVISRRETQMRRK